MERVILHADMNSFYASVECFLNPSLRGKAVAVCGDQVMRHGIILAKTPPAKRCGVKTGEAIFKAQQKCPGLILVTARHDLYKKFSDMSRRIFLRYTPLVEPFGMDEAWLDISGRGVSMEQGRRVADDIRKAITRELGITASVGVSYNKIFAKLGSDMGSPNTTTVIGRDNYKDVVWQQPASDLLYVGPSTSKKLAKKHIETIGDIAMCDKDKLIRLFGKNGETLWCYANGYDQAPVLPFDHEREIKSIGSSTTTPRDLVTEADVKNVLFSLSANIATRLKKYHRVCRGVQVYIRYSDLKSIVRQAVIPVATDLSDDISDAAIRVFFANHGLAAPIRTLGVRATNLADTENQQLDIFRDGKKIAREMAIEQIKKRFGRDAIYKAAVLEDKSLTELGEGRRSIFPGSRL
ncbi:MAG: DNA polymerase IV [Christensenellaceae bacterium]|jgi:DNA polymerase-4